MVHHRLCMPDGSPQDRVAAILLAAGASTRLGTPKQLVLYRGEPLLRRAARSALEAGASPVLVVLAADRKPSSRLHTHLDRSAHTASQTTPSNSMADLSRQALAGLPVTLVENPDHSSGMGSSLRAGMAALLRHATPLPPSHIPRDRSKPDRVLLLVSDQPLLTPEHLGLLLAAPAPDGIVAAAYNGRLGVPAIFSRQHFAALAAVEGDHGARTLLRNLPATPFDLPEAALDIDTPDDLRDLSTQAL